MGVRVDVNVGHVSTGVCGGVRTRVLTGRVGEDCVRYWGSECEPRTGALSPERVHGASWAGRTLWVWSVGPGECEWTCGGTAEGPWRWFVPGEWRRVPKSHV